MTERLRDSKWKKILKDFGVCHENSLIESFKMSPHLIGLSWGLKSLLWPASGSGLDVIWKLIPQLRHIKWGLILKLSLRPFLSHHLESLRIFFHFMSPCRAVRHQITNGWISSTDFTWVFIQAHLIQGWGSMRLTFVLKCTHRSHGKPSNVKGFIESFEMSPHSICLA